MDAAPQTSLGIFGNFGEDVRQILGEPSSGLAEAIRAACEITETELALRIGRAASSAAAAPAPAPAAAAVSASVPARIHSPPVPRAAWSPPAPTRAETLDARARDLQGRLGISRPRAVALAASMLEGASTSPNAAAPASTAPARRTAAEVYARRAGAGASGGSVLVRGDGMDAEKVFAARAASVRKDAALAEAANAPAARAAHDIDPASVYASRRRAARPA